jgi:hypothetical protein
MFLERVGPQMPLPGDRVAFELLHDGGGSTVLRHKATIGFPGSLANDLIENAMLV